MAPAYRKRKLSDEPHEALVAQVPARAITALRRKAEADFSTVSAVVSDILVDFVDGDELSQLRSKEQALLHRIALQAVEGVEKPGDPNGEINSKLPSLLLTCRQRIGELMEEMAT